MNTKQLRAMIYDSLLEGLSSHVPAKEQLSEGRLNKGHAAKVEKAITKLVKSVDSVVVHRKNDTLFVNYTAFTDRAKVKKAVTALGYKYDNDGRSTNAPRGILGVGWTNWMSFIKQSTTEGVVTEAKDNLYLQLHKKYADQIKGLKAKKIKKLTDLVSVQRWAMEDEHDTPGHDHKKMSKTFNNERKLFKQYMAGDHSVMLPEGLWANINAKKKRGEKSAPKGSKAYKAAKKAGDKLEKTKESVNEAAIPKLEKELEKVILKYMKDKEHTIPNITQTVKLFPFSKFAKYYKTKKAAGLAEPQVEGKVNEGLKVKDWHEETRPDKIVIKTSNGKTLEITPKRGSSEKSYQAWLQILDQYKTNPKAASHVDKTITQMANESVNEARKEKIFKKGAKVKYLSNPGVITKVKKDIQGRVWYDVKYTDNWGNNWTSADMILSTAGSITEGKLNEAPSIWKKLDQIMDLRMKSMDVEQNIMDREQELKRLYQGQEQEAEPEGGRVSNRYAKDIESLTKILNKDKAILRHILKKIDKLDQF